MTRPAIGVKDMVVSMGLRRKDGGHAGAVAEVGENDAAGGGLRVESCRSVHEIGVGEAVEAEAADAGVGELAGYRQKFCHRGHVAVEGGVETGDLRASGKNSCKRFDQSDLAREMGHIQRLGSTKLGDYIGSDEPVFKKINAAVDNPMTDGGNRVVAKSLVDVCRNRLGGVFMGFGSDRSSIFCCRAGTFGDELGIGVADAFYLAGEDSLGESLPVKTANLMLDEPALTVRINDEGCFAVDGSVFGIISKAHWPPALGESRFCGVAGRGRP